MVRAGASGSTRRRSAGVTAAVTLLGAGLLLVAAPARSGSTDVKGQLTSEPVTGSVCSSPVGICTRGTLKGALKGQFTFTASSVTASADSPTTGVVGYLGDMVITTKGGTLTCKDAGVFANTGDRSLASVCTVLGGTGEFEVAGGRLRLTGTTPDFTSGGPSQGFAHYEGTITP